MVNVKVKQSVVVSEKVLYVTGITRDRVSSDGEDLSQPANDSNI